LLGGENIVGGEEIYGQAAAAVDAAAIVSHPKNSKKYKLLFKWNF
jgi:dihydrofolate reductase